jgi:hypothetical protein
MFEYSIGSIVKVYETNTGNLMGTVTLPNQILSDRGNREGAADSGLKEVADRLAKPLKFQIINYWFAMSDPRQGQDIVLEVAGMTFASHRALLDALSAIKEFNEVNGEFGNEQSTFTLKSTVRMSEAAVHIDDILIGGKYKVIITATRGNRIVGAWGEKEF